MKHDLNALESLTLSLDGLTEQEKKFAWVDYCSAMFDVTIVDVEGEPFCGKVQSSLLNNVILAEQEFSAQMGTRTPAHIAKDGFPFLAFQIYSHGGAKAIKSDQSSKTAEGIAVLADFSVPRRFIMAASQIKTAIIPFDLVNYDPRSCPSEIVIDAQHATGELVIQAFGLLLKRLPDLSKEEGKILETGFCSLIEGVVNQNRAHESQAMAVSALRLDTTRKFIDQNLSVIDLSVADISRALGISRATLYRDFAPSGGLQRYITSKRLDRAFDELMQSAGERGAIARLVERSGFSSASAFSRMFKDKFDIVPSDVIGLGRRKPETFDDASISSSNKAASAKFRTWLKH